jgi:hypothetical protein
MRKVLALVVLVFALAAGTFKDGADSSHRPAAH